MKEENNSKIKDSFELPKIALIADVRNWAFHNISKQIVKNLSNLYDFTIYFYGEYEKIEDLLIEVKDFDLIHFFWRDALFSFLSERVKNSITNSGRDYQEFLTERLCNANITTSVSEHLLLSETESKERVILYNCLSVGYTVFSERLKNLLNSISNYPPPDFVTSDGVDLTTFTASNPERFYIKKEEIVVGWVGNSKWGQANGVDHKGLETIIKPAVAALQAEGYNIRGLYADRHEKWIPHSQMNDYYNSIDIYVCASDIEGTPNPALESMACGLPVISTDVGMIPQLFGVLQQNYILPERSVEALKAKLKELIENPEQRAALSRENLAEIKKWSWENQCQKWNMFFKKMLANSNDVTLCKRRNYLREQTLSNYLFNIEQENVAESLSKFELINQVIKKDAEDSKLNSQLLIDQLHLQINLIEQSKFWKIRNIWFKLKDSFR